MDKPDRYLIRNKIVLPIYFGASGFYFIHLDKLI
ncbi:putative membrane protein, partial [Escherichia coli FRIK1985]